jgi:hypothetical protein
LLATDESEQTVRLYVWKFSSSIHKAIFEIEQSTGGLLGFNFQQTEPIPLSENLDLALNGLMFSGMCESISVSGNVSSVELILTNKIRNAFDEYQKYFLECLGGGDSMIAEIIIGKKIAEYFINSVGQKI